MNKSEQDAAYQNMPLPPVREISELVTPPLVDELQEALQQHGCMVEEKSGACFIRFPDGTKRVEIWPRMFNERYQITLPDGYVLYQVCSRIKETNLLFYMPEHASP